jgi:drug/metabolite transporter (DMT)-like permease
LYLSRWACIFAAALSQREVLLPLLFLAAVCSVIAFFCLNYGMTYLEVSRAVVFTNITPVVSVIAGTALLGEPFPAVCVAGMILILTGLFMVNRIKD